MIGIGGTGMAALAGMLKSAGYRVGGSDAHVYPPMSDILKQQGVDYADGYHAANIDRDIDLVVIGNAVSKSNPEVQSVLERGLPYHSFPQALSNIFLRDRVSIVIAGTHGKTTTSALTAWVLDQAGLDPGFLIGGCVKNFNGNSRSGKGKYFVVEGDEYDTAFFDKGPKFLHYRPSHVILTSIEFDHADIFSDLEQIKQAFASLVRIIPSEGILVSVHGDPHIEEVLSLAGCTVETYGIDSEAVWRAEIRELSSKGVCFRVFHHSKQIGEFISPMLGRHNILNALSVIGLATYLGVPAEKIRSALESFKGVSRRQEVLGTFKGITVIDDFAHHPTAIRETLSALRLQYPDRRLWTVFEPRSATSRRRVFQDDLPRAFQAADHVVIAGLFSPETIPEEQRLDPQRVVAELVTHGKQALYIPTVDEILDELLNQLEKGDVVCIMSSGAFGDLHGKLVKALEG